MGCVSLVLYDEEFARRQEFMSALDDLRSAVESCRDDIKAALEVLVDTVKDIVKEVVHTIVKAWNKISACIVPPRVLYLSKHGKTARVRKKNLNRIKRIWSKLLKGGLD